MCVQLMLNYKYNAEINYGFQNVSIFEPFRKNM